MALLLNCESLSKAYGIRPLFVGISFGLNEGERSGLIGPNGAGKSTLLRVIAGLEKPDSGQITTRRQLRLAYVPQEDQFSDGVSVEQVLIDAQHGDEHIDEHDRVVAASVLLDKMGFASPEQQVATLSGGWRKRLAIARALIASPELLLLDEPTNHLDLEGILWLEKLLATAPFALLMVSHDRYFLENVTNRTIELSRAYPDGYLSINGPYDEFLARREEFLAAQRSQQVALESKVRREIEWLKRGAKARTTKAKGRIDEANRLMDELAQTKVRNTQNRAVQIAFDATQRQTRKLLAAKGLTKTLGGRVLFREVEFVLSPGTKLGLLGPNGSGKTTLLRLLTGELAPDAGQIQRADGLRLVLFQQAREALDKQLTLRQALSPKSDTVVYRDKPMHVTSWAKRLLFRTEQLDLPVGDLSGGEQARLLMAQMMLGPADVLILDEPTNDLDIPSLEVLEESLEDFPGALVLVTHDRFMLDRLCTDILALDGTGGAQVYADLSQWEAAQERAREEELRQAQAARASAAKPPPPAPKASAAKRLTWNEQRELEQMEQKILVAEEAAEAARKPTEDPQILSDHRRSHEAFQALHAAEEAVQKLYARWQELEAKRG